MFFGIYAKIIEAYLDYDVNKSLKSNKIKKPYLVHGLTV